MDGDEASRRASLRAARQGPYGWHLLDCFATCVWRAAVSVKQTTRYLLSSIDGKKGVYDAYPLP